MSAEQFDKIKKNKKNNPLFVGLLLVCFLVAAAFVFIKLFEVERPQVSLLTDVSLMGRQGVIELVLSDEKSGIQDYEVSVVQDKKKVKLAGKKNVRDGLFAKGPQRIEEKIKIDVSSLGFADGRADIMITAHDFSYMNMKHGNETIATFLVAFDTKPPKMQLVDSPSTIKPGSSGVVVYRSNEEIYNHGVVIDENFHPGFPISAKHETYGAMIGIPFDTENIGEISIVSTDKAGNSSRLSFGVNLRKIKKDTDRINVSDNFLQMKVAEFATYYPDLTGDPVDQYIWVNNDVRRENAKKIKEICSKSVPERLWDGRFGRMRRSSRRAGFAEYRSYYYNGKKIDSQVHLGIDLASVRQAVVEAANNGIVVFADYMGIYGNMVILDHGQGVFSLYSHLSQIKVAEGDSVSIGAEIGRTGTTGMAGGDHLHYSMLINGIFVNPLEWWDKGWLQLNITNFLQ